MVIYTFVLCAIITKLHIEIGSTYKSDASQLTSNVLYAITVRVSTFMYWSFLIANCLSYTFDYTCFCAVRSEYGVIRKNMEAGGTYRSDTTDLTSNLLYTINVRADTFMY